MEALELKRDGTKLSVTVRTRKRVPAYTLTGYKLRCTVYGFGGLPMEQHFIMLGPMTPGSTPELEFTLQSVGRVQVEIVRPTGFSVLAVSHG